MEEKEIAEKFFKLSNFKKFSILTRISDEKNYLRKLFKIENSNSNEAIHNATNEVFFNSSVLSDFTPNPFDEFGRLYNLGILLYFLILLFLLLI
jgi:hypothetical protein